MPQTLSKLAIVALDMIRDNIDKGVSYDGAKYKYSTNPFFRPYDGKLVAKMGKRQEGKLYKIIKKNDKKLGLIIQGYKDFKAKIYPDTKDDFLQATGRMMRNLSAIKTNDNNFVIGFTDPEQEQKAFWLNVSGVGRGRRLWKFLGLSKAQQKELAELASKLLAQDIEFNIKLIKLAQSEI